MTQIQSLEVMCGKDHMDVHLSFTQPFEGIVFSKGQYGDPRCVYVHPSTGRTFFSFRIAYARCGTKPDLHGQFYENTVVVQYDKDLLEVWDEAKRLRCEWFNDYEKTASKPPMVIADLDVIQLDFRGMSIICQIKQIDYLLILRAARITCGLRLQKTCSQNFGARNPTLEIMSLWSPITQHLLYSSLKKICNLKIYSRMKNLGNLNTNVVCSAFLCIEN